LFFFFHEGAPCFCLVDGIIAYFWGLLPKGQQKDKRDHIHPQKSLQFKKARWKLKKGLNKKKAGCSSLDKRT
jgi:hypothetical protein